MKRISSIILVFVLILSIGLTACGKKDESSTSTDTSSNSTTATSTSAVAEKPDPFGKYETPVTVSYGRQINADQKFKDGDNYTNNVWTREYESELGIVVKSAWETQDTQSYETKLNLLIASNDLPDLFKVNNQGQLLRLAESNLVEDLSSVFENYASPLVKEEMAKDGGNAIRQCTIGGKQVAYPTLSVKEEGIQYFFVRDDLRKALGKEEPKTFEDLVDLGKAMVQNGKTKYAFGFCSNPYDGFMSTLGVFNAFGAFPGSWIEKNGKLEYGGIQPEMKTALAQMNQLYKDGLIDKEFVVKDGTTASKDAVAGTIGIVSAQYWMTGWPLPDAWKADKNVDWRAYPILFAKDTANKVVMGKTAAVTSNSGTMCVKKGFANPEVVAKLHNYFMEKSYGATSDEKKYRVDGEVNIFTQALVQGGLAFNNIDIAKAVTAAIDNKDESVLKTNEAKAKYASVKGYKEGTASEQNNMTEFKFYYGPTSVFAIEQNYRDNNMLISDKFYGSETPEMLRRMSILTTNEKEMVIKIITGTMPIDEFDNFVKSWNDLGGAKITEEVNEWNKTAGK